MFVVSVLTFGMVPTAKADTDRLGTDAVVNQAEAPAPESVLHDKYGFITNANRQRGSLSKSSKDIERRGAKEKERGEKWLRMLRQWDFVVKFRKAKLQRRIRKGIPNVMRAWAWFHISHAQEYKTKYPDLSKIDTAKIPAKVKDDIEKDVDRTFPKHLQFAETDGHGQASLRRLLQWYAAIDEEVGYCQGMGFVAGLLLTYLEEEEAFYCFAAALMTPCPTPLREIYLPDLADAKRKMYVFGELGRQILGPLWTHLEEQGVHTSMYATEWLMTLFCRGFNFDLVTRVWDVYLFEGFKVVYRVALALLKVCTRFFLLSPSAPPPPAAAHLPSAHTLSLPLPLSLSQSIEKQLLTADFEDIMGLINAIQETVDVEDLMTLAWALPVRRKDIQRHEKAYALLEGKEVRVNI